MIDITNTGQAGFIMHEILSWGLWHLKWRNNRVIPVQETRLNQAHPVQQSYPCSGNQAKLPGNKGLLDFFR